MTSNSDIISNIDRLGLSIPKDQTRQKSDKLGQEAFLELMITQLKNQDPLKPMENGEFLGQMAQFGTVSGIQELQNSINGLAEALQSNQALQASALVGRLVLAPGVDGQLQVGGNLSGVVNMPDASTSLTLKITDQSGQLVRQLEMGPQGAGPANFKWDGLTNDGKPAPAGIYRVAAEAIIGGDVVGVDAQLAVLVESVSMDRSQGEIILNLSGSKSVPLSAISAIL
ncbi:MAG TPA: flagellar hook assembly protein FlgD [Acidiferrobacteraceae bacterium]|mgnify:CR=1 FL=1|nr:flagellar hook assembly protein FlgD [Acidiferrobacteraceae bacterium]